MLAAANPKATQVALVVFMHICYVDESGDTGALPARDSPIQPVFVLIGLILPQDAIRSLTTDWMQIKRQFFPNGLPPTAHYHDWMRMEVKGAELRKMMRSSARTDQRFAYGVIDKLLQMLETHGAKICGRVYIKEIAIPIDSTAIYTFTVQRVAQVFHHFLVASGTQGLIVADSRNPGKNSAVSHSILTQRLSGGGDTYCRLLEVPTFGHSENHAGLQLADLLCSALLFPIAAQVCSSPHIGTSIHCHPTYLELRSRFGERLKNLQYRYQEKETLRWQGGITLVDPLNKASAAVLFRARRLGALGPLAQL